MIHQVATESGKPNEVFATMAMLKAARVLLRQDGVIAFVRCDGIAALLPATLGALGFYAEAS